MYLRVAIEPIGELATFVKKILVSTAVSIVDYC